MTKKIIKGSLNSGTIALLFSILFLPASLFLHNNILFVKQNIILHVLEKVKETQIKVLGEEPDLPNSLVKALFMMLHSLLLVHY